MTEVKNTVEVVTNDSEKPAKVPFRDLSTKEKAKKISAITSSVIQLIVVAFAVFLSVVVILSTWKQSPGKVSTDPVFGLGFLTVQTASMDGPAEFYAEHPDWEGFAPGDLIVVKKFNPDKDVLAVGDVVTVYMPANADKIVWIINTHRIVEISSTASGTPLYITKGDNNSAVDLHQFVAADILCTWSGAKVVGFGTAMDWLKQPTPFLCCVVIPLALLFAVNLFFFVRALLKNKMDKQQKALQAQKAADVQAAIDALLAKQAAAGQPIILATEPTVGQPTTVNATAAPVMTDDERQKMIEEERQRIIEEERERARVYEEERKRIREEELAKIREEARAAALKEIANESVAPIENTEEPSASVEVGETTDTAEVKKPAAKKTTAKKPAAKKTAKATENK